MILGIHCAVFRGFAAALAEAEALGCGAMQMLPYRRHHEPAEEELSAFRELRAQSPVRRLLIHSRFVPSLGSSVPERRGRSIELLKRELALGVRLGGEAFILHAGAYSPGGEAEEGLRLAAEAVMRAAAEAAVSIPVCLENVPGGGRRMGGSLEELARWLELCRNLPGAGVCLDTAHAWAAGYDIAGAEGMLRFLSRVHGLIGADRVRAFHLNDTRALLGSRREHHENWGDGFLGGEGLKVLLQRPEYEAAVGILETPKGPEADRRNYDWVRGLAA